MSTFVDQQMVRLSQPAQLIDLLGRMTDAVIEVATAPGQPDGQAPTQPTEPAAAGS